MDLHDSVMHLLLELGLTLEKVLEHEPLVAQLLQASLELMLALALLLVLELMPELLQMQMIHLPESRPLSLGKDCHQSSL
jgi:hypothetical protein